MNSKIAFGLFILLGSILLASNKSVLTTQQIKSSEVIGTLGLPLGTCGQLQAVLIFDNKNGHSNYRKYKLKVTHVNNIKLQEPVISDFETLNFASSNIKIAGNSSSLYKLKYGKKPNSSADIDLEKIELGYVGRTVLITAYQTGSYHGLPNKIPNVNESFVPWSSTAFKFYTYIIVIDQQV